MNRTRSRSGRGLFGSGRLLAVAAVVAVSGMTTTACEAAHEEDHPATARATTATATTVTANRSPLTWGDCPPQAEGAPARNPAQVCATLEVPLNYQDPDGKKITIAVSKIPAADSAARPGVLLLNPGGPGDSGLDMPTSMAAQLPESVLSQYDLIGFDPRGVGLSTPQSCGLSDPSAPFPYPAPDGSIDQNIANGKALAQQCASGAPELKYFTTANTARDLDRLREDLGEDKISYWGQSYGTYLGTVYASLFPARTDRMILEGVVDGTKVWQQESATWGQGMDDRFPDAAKVAVQQQLGLGKTVAAVEKTYIDLTTRLDAEPAKVPGAPVSLTGTMIRNLTYGLLMRNENLPIVTQVWKAADDLSKGALTKADTKIMAQVLAPTAGEPGVPQDNTATMFLSIICGDVASSTDLDHYRSDVAADRKAHPLSGGMPVNVWPCAFWDAPLEQPVAVSNDASQGGRNILLLQNRRDNATPWEGALGLRQALGDRASLVGVNNGGHYVYGTGSDCADQAANAFLTGGARPDQDVSCTDA